MVSVGPMMMPEDEPETGEPETLRAEIARLRQLIPTAEECLRLIQSIEECAWGVPVTLLPKLKATMAMLEEGQE